MESENFYLKLVPWIQGQESERAKIIRIIEQASPDSTDRAAYQLLNLELIQDKHPALHAQIKAVLVNELQANLFSQIYLRTTVAILAVIGSHWAPDRGLLASIQKLVEDAVIINAQSPIYQVFFRAVDYRWDEMVRVGSQLGKFGSSVALDMGTEDVTDHSGKVWVSGTDAVVFGSFVLPGFLRGVMSVLGVTGSVEITEEDTKWIELSVRW